MDEIWQRVSNYMDLFDSDVVVDINDEEMLLDVMKKDCPPMHVLLEVKNNTKDSSFFLVVQTTYTW